MQLKSKIKMFHGWRAEWCDHCPIIDGDAEFDSAHYVRRSFATLKEAQAYAEEVMKTKQTFFGCVQIDEFNWVECDFAPWLCELEYVGETVEVS
jgi:hypothetical protein